MPDNVQDALTGMWSRFGLLFFAEHYLKLLRRVKREALIFVVGIDGVPADGPADPEQEARLHHAARLLRRTFRTSDAVARIEPDVFAVLLLETSELAADALLFRLEDRLAEWQVEHADLPPLTLHLVADRIRADQEMSFQDALARTVDALRTRQAARPLQSETGPPLRGWSADAFLPAS